MGVCVYTDKKSIFGMTYGSFRGLVDDVCEYLREKVSKAGDDEALDALEDYTIEKYNISQAHCKRLFEMMSEDEEYNLRAHFHEMFRYEYEYPIKRLMYDMSNEWVMENLEHFSMSGNMGIYDFDRLYEMTMYRDPDEEDGKGKIKTHSSISRYYCGLDFWNHRIHCTNTPIVFVFDEPMGGAMDGALENLIIAMAHGAMSENGLYIS